MKLLKKLHPSTIVTIVAYAILLISVIIPCKDDPNSKKYTLNERILFALIMLPSCIISVISVQCLISGRCNTLAWYNAILIMIWCLFVVMFCLKK